MIDKLSLDQISLVGPDSELVFDRLDFEFPMNGIYWVRGAMGSGRSLLLRLMAGLLEPVEGRYLINGEDVTAMSFEEFVPYRKRIGYGFEMGGLMSNRTIKQNLMLPFFFHRDLSAQEAEARVNEYLVRFHLPRVKDLRPAQISGGLRKVSCVARALITEPELLILDHPSSGLDDQNKRALINLIHEQRKNKRLRHVFVSTEDEEFMRRLGAGIIDVEGAGLRIEREAA